MGQRVRGVGADRHRDREQAVVDREIGFEIALLGGDIRGLRRRDAPVLDDARCDQRDVIGARAARRQLRARLHVDRRDAAAVARESDLVRVERLAIAILERDLVGRKQQAADIEPRRGTRDDAAGAVEPDVAATRSAIAEHAGGGAVEGDAARLVGRDNAVEDAVILPATGADERRDVDAAVGVQRILEVDRSGAGLQRRRPGEDGVGVGEGDRRLIGRGVAGISHRVGRGDRRIIAVRRRHRQRMAEGDQRRGHRAAREQRSPRAGRGRKGCGADGEHTLPH